MHKLSQILNDLWPKSNLQDLMFNGLIYWAETRACYKTATYCINIHFHNAFLSNIYLPILIDSDALSSHHKTLIRLCSLVGSDPNLQFKATFPVLLIDILSSWMNNHSKTRLSHFFQCQSFHFGNQIVLRMSQSFQSSSLLKKDISSYGHPPLSPLTLEFSTTSHHSMYSIDEKRKDAQKTNISLEHSWRVTIPRMRS